MRVIEESLSSGWGGDSLFLSRSIFSLGKVFIVRTGGGRVCQKAKQQRQCSSSNNDGTNSVFFGRVIGLF